MPTDAEDFESAQAELDRQLENMRALDRRMRSPAIAEAFRGLGIYAKAVEGAVVLRLEGHPAAEQTFAEGHIRFASAIQLVVPEDVAEELMLAARRCLGDQVKSDREEGPR